MTQSGIALQTSTCRFAALQVLDRLELRTTPIAVVRRLYSQIPWREFPSMAAVKDADG
jgi:hypothetical protein